jgi:GNAT superfamily N-acetyltransferase
MTDDTDTTLDRDAVTRQVASLTRRSLAALAEHVTAFDGGFAVRTTALPLVWTLNQVRIAGPTTAGELAALADRFQEGLSFRHVVVEGEQGALLVAQLAAAGWWSEREVLMAMTGPVDRGIDTTSVVELSERQMMSLMRQWLLEERVETTDDGLDQVAEYSRREGALFDETRLGVVHEGTPVAITKLRASERIAWVEDVYTAPSARGRGLARALVAEAVTRAWKAQPAFAFIIADDQDWPKHFYARAGFVPMGCNYTFHLGAA